MFNKVVFSFPLKASLATPNRPSFLVISSLEFHLLPQMALAQQKVVLRVMTMIDDKTKQKAIEAAADIYGVDSIAVDAKEQKLTVIGLMDPVAVVKRLKKVAKVDILSVGPAKEEKKEAEKKEAEKKEDKK